MTDISVAGVPRASLVERKLARDGWIILVVALVLPFLGLWVAASNGRRLVRAGHPQGWPLVVLGVGVFVVRGAMYFTGTWPN